VTKHKINGKITRRYKIRKAKLNEAHKIYLLGKKIHELDFSRKHPFHDFGEIREFISSPHENIMLIAEQEGEIVGFVYAKILSHSTGGWCMLDNLGVEHAHRGQGISNALLHKLYKELRKRKVRYVQILEEIHHKKTRSFWKKQGYKETKNFLWAERTI
jgi:predicted N-acetyltransferase YhbS